MAQGKPWAGKHKTGDEAGIAVLILCLGHAFLFQLGATLRPELQTVTPQAEILSRLLSIVAVLVSLVVLATGYCLHHQLRILARCGVGSILLLIASFGSLGCYCVDPSKTDSVEFYCALLNAIVLSVPCLILISAHFQNRKTLWLMLRKPRLPEKKRPRRLV